MTRDRPAQEAIDRPLQVALKRISTEARADGLSAEQLVVIFKRTLDSLPALRAVDASLSAAEFGRVLKGTVVTACIEAYYAADGRASDGAEGRPL
jgi:hypothetical protein